MQLTNNYLRFCEEYLSCRNVFKAAMISGIPLYEQLPDGYYVYLLVEKETGRIFYIGKGKGKRASNHFKPYQIDNVFKAQEIWDIADRGNTPCFYILESNITERKAFEIERELIDKLYNTGLTNERKGCTLRLEKEIFKVKRTLASIIPFDVWSSIKPRSKASINNYWFIVNELKSLIKINQPQE
jgi:hypothetical protein